MLANEEFEELVKSSTEKEDEEEADEEPVMGTVEKFAVMFQIA